MTHSLSGSSSSSSQPLLAYAALASLSPASSSSSSSSTSYGASTPSSSSASSIADSASSTSSSLSSSTPEPTPTLPRLTIEPPLDGVHKVFQGRAAISSSKPLVVTSFGPSYIVGAHHAIKRLSFLAYITSRSDINSLSHCLEILNVQTGGLAGRNSLPEFRWFVVGGWKDDPVSQRNGDTILQKLQEKGLFSERIDLSRYQEKSTMTRSYISSDKELLPHAFLGVSLDPIHGNLCEFTQSWGEFEKEDEQISSAWIEESVIDQLVERERVDADKKEKQWLAATLNLPIMLEIVGEPS